MTEDIYRHKNGLKHINLINSDGFSALFVVNTPVFDNSGVAHGVEHMVFRRSTAFPTPETLFQLTSLTDAKINASTFAETTYFHCQSQCYHTFMLAINYLLNGLFNPIFNSDDLRYEIHDGVNKGVIYQELIGIEQAHNEEAKSTQSPQGLNQDNFFYGGISTSIGDLSLNDLSAFHQRFYQASNITLVTANADIEQIANLVTLLPKQPNQSKQIKTAIDKYEKQSQTSVKNKVKSIEGDEKNNDNKDNKHHQKKYSPAINKLITVYHLWLQDTYDQKIDDYKEIESVKKPFVNITDTLPVPPQGDLIPPLVNLSNKLIKDGLIKYGINGIAIKSTGVNSISIKKSPNKPSLPSLFSKLCQEAKKHLNIKKSKSYINIAYENDQRNALWLTDIDATEEILATITSYIISAYPKFLAPRCQGVCYATQALTIENSAYLAIYSAFDVNTDERLKEIALSLLELSQDKRFISMSLALAKIKFCQVNHVNNSQVITLSSADISAYLQVLANSSHPKV
ncbi:MAG: hypothetical protein ACJAXJ_001985 [Colwellia sp.]|jgi:hypothetical protein